MKNGKKRKCMKSLSGKCQRKLTRIKLGNVTQSDLKIGTEVICVAICCTGTGHQDKLCKAPHR